MNKFITINDVQINMEIRDGQIFANTKDIAKVFDKRHDNILRDLRAIQLKDKSGLLKIELSSYINKQNKVQPMYNLDKDAFSILVMSFTSEKAFQWKLPYIQAFNAMEKYIQDKILVDSTLEIQLLKNTIEQKDMLIADQQKHQLVTYVNGNKSLRKILKEHYTNILGEKEVWQYLVNIGLVKYVPRTTHIKILLDDSYGEQEIDSIIWDEEMLIPILEDIIRIRNEE